MIIDKPGIYDISAERYHQDICPTPSLSSSVANILISDSPLHAWAAHPRLNPKYERTESERFDKGTAAHAYVLQGFAGFAIIDAPDWRTKAAKEQRDAARAEGKTPLLADQFTEVQEMGEAILKQLAMHKAAPTPFVLGQPERAMFWKEGDIWCRALVDWLHDDLATICDLKTLSGSANPASVARTLYGIGADVQVAFYLRGLKAITGNEGVFRYVCVENYAPYCLSVVDLDPASVAMASRKVEVAIETWKRCLADNRWPGYPGQVCSITAPPWEEAKWIEREMRGVA